MISIDWLEIWDKEQNDGWQATYIAKVFGGWLVRHEYHFDSMKIEEKYDYEGYTNREFNMVFIPDSKHEWGEDLMEIIG